MSQQDWHRHFLWNGPLLVGRTANGRATVSVLAMNEPRAVELRQEFIEEVIFPPFLPGPATQTGLCMGRCPPLQSIVSVKATDASS